MPEWTVDQVLTRAQRIARPALLYFFDSKAPYYGGHERLDSLLLSPQVIRVIGTKYVFKIFDRKRGAGIEAAVRFGVNTINPVLLFLTPTGRPAYRWNIDSYEQIAPWSAVTLANWLDVWSRPFARGSDELFADAAADTSNLNLQCEAAQRSWALGERPATRQWLKRVVEADTSVRKGTASRAAWQSILIQLAEEGDSRGQTAAREYLKRYPAYGMPAVKLLAASGAGTEELDAAITAVVDSASYAQDLGSEETAVHLDINAIVYDALDLGAYDGALNAARAQTRVNPESANAYDTLAEALAARGNFDEAVAMGEEGLRYADSTSPMAEKLRGTIRSARNNMAAGESGSNRRELVQSLAPVTGEGKLFYDTFPDELLRRTLRMAMADYLRNDAEFTSPVVVRAKMGAGGRVEVAEVLTSGLSPEKQLSISSYMREVRVPFEADGLEVLVAASPGSGSHIYGCGCS